MRKNAANVDHRIAAAAVVVHRRPRGQDLSRSYGQCTLPRAVRGCGLGASARAGDRGPRYLYRRRRALRRGSRRHELAELPVAAPGRVQHSRRARDLQYPRGHILHDYLEARVFPRIVGPLGPGNLQYAAMWKVAQRLTTKPVKFGTILPELLAASAADSYYKDPVERTMALSEALNKELNDLADAGCPVIQLEEPQIHMVPARGKAFGKLDTQDLVGVFNNTVKGLRAKTEVWCHTCWGNPSQQRMFKEIQSYQPTLE